MGCAILLTLFWVLLPQNSAAQSASYPLVDTGQTSCYNDLTAIQCPTEGDLFSGQDAQFTGNQPSYTDHGNGTVTDNVTGLMWQQSADTDGDGDIDAADKLTYDEATGYCDNLSLAGYTDWRLPDIKQLYSLIDFSGTDPSGYNGLDISNLKPFLNDEYFAFAYGDTSAGERIIDAQYASSTRYVGMAMGREALFGVNLADGRIKAYPLDKTFFVICTRGNNSYGQNALVDNEDGTITDQATGLMWAQQDSGAGFTWDAALAWVQQQNDANYLGYRDWRLPNAKELQSIVDYTRSPDTSSSAAIDPLFDVTGITNEAGEPDYPSFWSSTTHLNWTNDPAHNAVYVAFGRAMGYMHGVWSDVHGAGAQRSDPKMGDPSEWPTGHGPQGDAIRITNYVRLVRDADAGSQPSVPTATVTPFPPADETATVVPTAAPTAMPTTSPEVPARPDLNWNYPDGCPGSFFTLHGTNFPPLTRLELRINNRLVHDQLRTTADGNIVVLLNTSNAGTGTYTITLRSRDAQVSASDETSESQESLTLSADAPLREREQVDGAVEVSLTAGAVPARRYHFLPMLTTGNRP
ncbi:MAG: DUF1566 domain-containing protein [Chloroflexaceae bacterium]|nr:DUF1566 domain-containing protein [Chloroflexaceae bacterium]